MRSVRHNFTCEACGRQWHANVVDGPGAGSLRRFCGNRCSARYHKLGWRSGEKFPEKAHSNRV